MDYSYHMMMSAAVVALFAVLYFLNSPLVCL